MNKIIVFFIFCFFYLSSNAEVIYETDEKVDDDFNHISMQEIEAKFDHGNHKYDYLMALHMVRNEQQKDQGVNVLIKLAALDVLDAKHALYEISSRVHVNYLTKQRALDYLKEAAEEGYAASQVELARAYNVGDFGKSEPSISHYWLLKAAEQGNAEAMFFVASNYYTGRGIPKDDKKGFEWLSVLYNKMGRNFEEWGKLGNAYEKGRGTPIDLAKAYMCYDLDGTAGIEDKARIAPRMTPEQRAEGLRLSQEWQEKNHVYTMQSLGLTRQKDGSYQ